MPTPVTSWEREVLAALGGNVGNSTTGSATALKQDEIIALLAQLRDRLTETAPLTPSLEIAVSSGTISAGAKLISIAIKTGTGTILGTPVDTAIAVVELPYLPMGYVAVPYTVDAGGEFVILSAR